jgi:hypothetical protein
MANFGSKERDLKRFAAVRGMIEARKLSGFKDIYNVVPKSVVSKWLGFNYQTINLKSNKPNFFTVGDIRLIAVLFGVRPTALLELIEMDLEREAKDPTEAS